MGQTAGASVITIGYEGRLADGFLKDLTGSGIQILVDVREMPISRKRGFSKSTLSELVQKAGISISLLSVTLRASRSKSRSLRP